MSIQATKPQHVAIIMDGNGRWAKKRFLPRVAGHREGAVTVKKIITHAAKIGVKYLTMFAFSTENFARPKDEVSFLMKMFYEYLESEYNTIIKNNISFVASGRLEMLPTITQTLIRKLEIDSSKNNGMVLNLAVSYSGKDEIVDMTKAIVAEALKGNIEIKDINDDLMKKYLYNQHIPDIDLLLRTSGESRISNFMLYRLAYAELYFTNILWPDFTESDFDDAIAEFSKRIRRYGKTDEQIS